jgi:hypothetical protein
MPRIETIPPNSINDLLTRRAFDEQLRLAYDSYFDGITDPVLQVVIAFFSRSSNHGRVSARIDRPACCQSKSQFEHVGGMVPQGASRQEFT